MSTSTPDRSHRIDTASAALWASAFLLTAMILVQAGRLAWPLGSPAKADVVSRVGEFTALTFNSGNDDVLAVLDGRGEQLFAYRIRAQNRLELLRAHNLTELFDVGRRLGPGRR